jgi:type VI secretion system protein ImpL
MREVAYNTHLEEEGAASRAKGLLESAQERLGKSADVVKKAKSMVGGAPARELGPADVESAFADFVQFGVPPPPPPGQDGAPSTQKPQQVQLDIYQEQLEFVRDALATSIENPESTQQLVARLQGARTRVRALIESQPVGWRPLYETLLWPPIEGASSSTENAVASGKGIQWCNEVVVPYDRNLKAKYPFNPSGTDAPLADVSDFYKPDGVLWKFYQASLAADVPQVGDHFEFSTRLGKSTGFSAQLLTFLARSREVSSVLFPPGAKDPLVEFEIRIRPAPGVASIVFDLDGQSIKTQNEPDRWYRLRWPGEGKSHGAAIRVRGAQNLSETIQQEGEWGLFRLLEAGTVAANLSSRVFSVTWTLSSRSNVQITIDVRPTRTDSPFFGTSRRSGVKLLQSFRGGDLNPPHAIARGGGCRVGP